jgi:hypothetical protein
VYDFDPARIVPDESRSLREGAIAAYQIFRDPRNDTWYLAAEID